MVTKSLDSISLFNWTHKGHEFLWNNPIQIAILYSFVELIFFNVECSKVIPTELDGIFKTLQTLEKGALVVAVTFTGISVVLEQW